MSTNEKEELAYSIGARMAWTRMLQTALRELGHDAPDSTSLLIEREQAITALRSLCADFGDNDWPDDLHLADVIEKHLGKYLNMDYRALLIRYLAHVHEREGTTSLRPSRTIFLSAADLAELKLLEIESKRLQPDDREN